MIETLVVLFLGIILGVVIAWRRALRCGQDPAPFSDPCPVVKAIMQTYDNDLCPRCKAIIAFNVMEAQNDSDRKQKGEC